jgi:hypothetical protein
MTIKVTLLCNAGQLNCKPQKYLANYRECFITSVLSYVAGFCLENTTQQKLANKILFGMFVMESWKKCKLYFQLLHKASFYTLTCFQLPTVAIGTEL